MQDEPAAALHQQLQKTYEAQQEIVTTEDAKAISRAFASARMLLPSQPPSTKPIRALESAWVSFDYRRSQYSSHLQEMLPSDRAAELLGKINASTISPAEEAEISRWVQFAKTSLEQFQMELSNIQRLTAESQNAIDEAITRLGAHFDI